jgi:hypothetical protein
MRFVTYNVLSSSLGTPAAFPGCDPGHLDPITRLAGVLDKVRRAMGSNTDTVFGFQEVSLAWVAEFRQFFETLDYTFVHSCYGTHFNGYMGVALAAPRAVDPQQVESVVPPHLADPGFQTWQAARRADQARWYNKSARLLKDSLPFRPILEKFARPNQVDPQTLVSTRPNRAIFALVNNTRAHPTKPRVFVSTRVAVAVYHMPCLFQYPTVMAAHVVLLNRSFHQYCIKHNIHDRVVLVDGNFESGSDAYNLMRGIIPVPNVGQVGIRVALDELSPGIWDETVHEWMAGMRHVYPRSSITNYTRGWTGAEFCGKIDYIWASHGLVGHMMPAESMAPVRYKSEQSTYLPNAAEPSDHYMLAVDLF